MLYYNGTAIVGTAGDLTWDTAQLKFTNGILAVWEDSSAVEQTVLTLNGLGSGGDPLFDFVVMLIHFDGADAATTATDETGNHTGFTFNDNAALDTSQMKFGTASLEVDGTGGSGTADQVYTCIRMHTS